MATVPRTRLPARTCHARGSFAAAVRGSRRVTCAAGGLAAVFALGVAGCGGESKRQDGDEPRGTFPVEVSADFPRSQQLAVQETLRLRVRNEGERALPN